MEELFKEKLSPLNCDIEGSCLCRDVSRMHYKLKQGLLRVEFKLGRAPVNHLTLVLAIADALLLQQSLHIIEVRGVTSHISRQYNPNEPLPECLEVVT